MRASSAKYGLLLVLAFVLAAGLTALPAHPWWQRATLAPVFETAVLAARPWLPADLSRRLRYAVDAARAAARPALAGQSDRRFACAA